MFDERPKLFGLFLALAYAQCGCEAHSCDLRRGSSSLTMIHDIRHVSKP